MKLKRILVSKLKNDCRISDNHFLYAKLSFESKNKFEDDNKMELYNQIKGFELFQKNKKNSIIDYSKI
ncbi:hypothetical protein SH2C18_04270 [Clostridium sediminicola]